MTQADLFSAQSDPWPDVVCESIRKPYPHPRDKKTEMAAVRRTLDRLCAGELDGEPMAPQAAIAFLREKVEGAAELFYGREKKFVPHLTTYLNQSRYLKTETTELPQNLEEAMSILKLYPGISVHDVDVQSHLPVLKVIDAHIEYYKATHGAAAASFIRQRVFRFAECVAKWSEQEYQYIPNPMKFFGERRYEWPDSRYSRKAPTGYEAERQQIHRVAATVGGS